MRDLQRYIAKRKATDAEFAAGFDSGYSDFRIGVLLRMLPRRFKARALAYDTSGRITGDYENSVSYAALGFYREGQM